MIDEGMFYVMPEGGVEARELPSGRKPFRVSASQIKTFEDCPRKWGFDKLDGIKAPQNRYAAFGSRVHSILEEWFDEGTPPPNTDEGRVAFNILQHLPVPQTEHLEAERKIELVVAGVPLLGFVDLSILEGRTPPFVSDHKTTSDLRWALDEDDMPEDVQCAIYAIDAMLRTNETTVELQWTYGTRDGKKHLPVVREVTLDEIRPRLERAAATVEEMREIYENHIDSATELPYDASSCEKFGGCYYRPNCNLSPRERMQSIMSQNDQKSAFLAKLRAKKNKGANGASTHPPPAEPVEEPKGTTTNKGTVNPPSAPDEAAASPETEEPKKSTKKKRTSKRRPKKTDAEKAADKANAAKAEERAASPDGATASERAMSAPTPSKVSKPTPPAPKPVAGASGGMVPMSEVKHMVELLVAKYREGFRDGLAASKEFGS